MADFYNTLTVELRILLFVEISKVLTFRSPDSAN